MHDLLAFRPGVALVPHVIAATFAMLGQGALYHIGDRRTAFVDARRRRRPVLTVTVRMRN